MLKEFPSQFIAALSVSFFLSLSWFLWDWQTGAGFDLQWPDVSAMIEDRVKEAWRR